MKRKFKLAPVLRARRAQENAAKGDVARARLEAVTTDEHARLLDQELEARIVHPETSTALAFAATRAALRARATDLSAARAAADRAHGMVGEHLAAWSAASSRRRSVEKLGERHAEAVRRADEAADQRAVDDLTTRRKEADR
ncbi:flagellar FliJ family protein [Spirillospora albida]|uniref:flagellar FliJ family protein n=1 Tax=Spirillospora albida TaxID=58123 RepID=UPI0004C19A20|nr:hypothetical protein [Spirillospora albida]